MAEWSPECVRCSWVKGATGPVVGARFKARNRGRRAGLVQHVDGDVADPGRQFAFNRSGPGIGSYTWRYVMEPTVTGTSLTEWFEAERPLGSVMAWLTEKWTGSVDRDADLHAGMVTALDRVKAAAEQDEAARTRPAASTG